MTDLKKRPARFFDDHDVVDTLSGGIWNLKHDDTRREIMKDLKEEEITGKATVQFEWHHAKKIWHMNVYGDGDMAKGIGYIFDADEVDLPIPEPQPKEELSHGGERIEMVWMHDSQKINQVADDLLEKYPDLDRWQVISILDHRLTIEDAEIKINDTPYKLVRS